jgi:predicted peptidase
MNTLCTTFSATLSFCFLAVPCAAESADSPAKKQQEMKFEKQILKTVKLNYLLYLPKGYNPKPKEKYPLILFLHGAGERGDDLNRVKVHGIPKIVEQKDDFPFIAVSPQCPADSWWTGELEALNALLDDIIGKYAVDENRIYLTGLSMGGYGTWSLAIAYPKRFAAIVPICGGGGTSDIVRISAIKDVPAWVFHGAKDSVVKLEQSERMVNALKQAGGNVKFTVYPDADHDSWTATYDNPELYEWLSKQSKIKK